jgi:hypothetical protein
MLVILLQLGCAAQGDIYSRPDEGLSSEAKIQYEGDTVRYTDNAIMIELTYMYPRNLDTYYEHFQGGKYSNPFSENAHMAFSITMENLSEGVLNYNPRLTMLITESDAPIRPKDYTSLYTDFELINAGDTELRMQSYKATCFDNSVIIQPGERIQKLMVFPRKDEASRGGLFVFGSVYLDYKSRDIPIEFRSNIYTE